MGADNLKKISELADRLSLHDMDVAAQNHILYLVLEHAMDGYFDLTIDTSVEFGDQYEYYSPRFWEIFGYEPNEKEHKAQSWMDLINEDDKQKALINFAEHVNSKGKIPYIVEARYTHKNGSIVWVLCRGEVVKWSESGEPLRLIGTHTDISKYKK